MSPKRWQDAVNQAQYRGILTSAAATGGLDERVNKGLRPHAEIPCVAMYQRFGDGPYVHRWCMDVGDLVDAMDKRVNIRCASENPIPTVAEMNLALTPQPMARCIE